MLNKTDLIQIFQDTYNWCRENKDLSTAIQRSIAETRLYTPEDYPALPARNRFSQTRVTVTRQRTFEAALKLHQDNPNKKIAVHNFASATNPGGGVTRGSRAQEECLCRCSTLYPVLNTKTLWDNYYLYHRNRHDVRYTDTCIYAPGIQIIKTDTDLPERLPQTSWCQVDVLTCAAPNLRPRPYNEMNPGAGEAMVLSVQEQQALHEKRARHMLTIAAAHGVDILVLGAFGCGAFQNEPEAVAKAYREILPEFEGYFSQIVFAVYCSPKDSRNYDVFLQVLGQ